jgi:hypothetical protein
MPPALGERLVAAMPPAPIIAGMIVKQRGGEGAFGGRNATSLLERLVAAMPPVPIGGMVVNRGGWGV